METNRRKKPSITNIWPDDIIWDILPRLPVNSLLRFKRVCKQWFRLIKSPIFISNHLRHSQPKQFSAIRTFRWDPPDPTRFGISLLHANDFFLDDCIPSLFPECFQYNHNVLTMVGSSNGLIVIAGLANSWWDTFILWNPSLRQYRILPSPKWIGNWIVSGGFWFVSEINDYRLFRFLVFDVDVELLGDSDEHVNTKYSNQAEVFSLRTGCWKQIKNVPNFINNEMGNYVVVNGVWYSIVFQNNFRRKVSLILSFDFKDEVFSNITLPDGFQQQLKDRVNLIVCRESLAVVATEKEAHHIWIMKNNSWAKLITIGPFIGFSSVLGTWSDTKFILVKTDAADRENGKHDSDLCLYDPFNQTLQEVASNREHKFVEAHNCVESLVSVNDPFSLSP